MRLPVGGEPGVKLVPTASGDVHLVLVEGADTAHERVPARAIAFDPSVVPPDSSAIDACERESRELDDAFVASALTLSQLELRAQGTVGEPSEPDAAVLPRPPLLTPYDVDAYDAHSTPTPSGDWICGVGFGRYWGGQHCDRIFEKTRVGFGHTGLSLRLS